MCPFVVRDGSRGRSLLVHIHEQAAQLGGTVELRYVARAGLLPELSRQTYDSFYKAVRESVLNAMDAMPAGGMLTLRTAEHDGNVRIEVADTGKGLTPEECSRLFTPYYTTKQMGTGLGLAIIQSVVSDHHGSISVTSEEGRGTTFRIEFPGATQGEVSRDAVAERSHSPPRFF